MKQASQAKAHKVEAEALTLVVVNKHPEVQ
jgi:hypothetical protein